MSGASVADGCQDVGVRDELVLFQILYFPADKYRKYRLVDDVASNGMSLSLASKVLYETDLPPSEEQEAEIEALQSQYDTWALPYLSGSIWNEEQEAALRNEIRLADEFKSYWSSEGDAVASTISSLGCPVVTGIPVDHLYNPVCMYAAVPERRGSELIALLERLHVRESVFHFYKHSCAEGRMHRFELKGMEGQSQSMTFDELLVKSEVDERKLDIWARIASSVNYQGDVFFTVLRNLYRPAEAVSFSTELLVPQGMVTLLVGPPKCGKSTLATQMAVCAAAKVPFLGLETSSREGFIVYLSGEDSLSVLLDRRDAILSAFPPEQAKLGCTRFLAFADSASLDDALNLITRIDVSLVVVDTAAAFTGGSLNDSGPVREFMNKWSDVARQKQCGVVVIHHTNKGKTLRNARDVYDNVKGSSEFASSARAILTMYSVGNARALAVAYHNMPASVPMLVDSLLLRYDPDTESHVVVADALVHAARHDRRDADIIGAVIQRAVAEGRSIALSGKNEPFNLRAAEVTGWPRSRVRAAHRAFLEIQSKG